MTLNKIIFSEKEAEQIDRIAKMRGISIDEAASQLCSEGVKNRMRAKARRAPCIDVRKFRRD